MGSYRFNNCHVHTKWVLFSQLLLLYPNMYISKKYSFYLVLFYWIHVYLSCISLKRNYLTLLSMRIVVANTFQHQSNVSRIPEIMNIRFMKVMFDKLDFNFFVWHVLMEAKGPSASVVFTCDFTDISCFNIFNHVFGIDCFME